MVKGVRAEKIVGKNNCEKDAKKYEKKDLTVFKLSMMGNLFDIFKLSVKQDGVDIAVVGGVGLMVAQRVEVKTVLQSDDTEDFLFLSKGQDRRCYTRKDCDIIALASLSDRVRIVLSSGIFHDNKSMTLGKE